MTVNDIYIPRPNVGGTSLNSELIKRLVHSRFINSCIQSCIGWVLSTMPSSKFLTCRVALRWKWGKEGKRHRCRNIVESVLEKNTVNCQCWQPLNIKIIIVRVQSKNKLIRCSLASINPHHRRYLTFSSTPTRQQQTTFELQTTYGWCFLQFIRLFLPILLWFPDVQRVLVLHLHSEFGRQGHGVQQFEVI